MMQPCCCPDQPSLAIVQAASTEAAFLRKGLAADSDSARTQIAELEARAGAAVAERDALLAKARISCHALLRASLHTCWSWQWPMSVQYDML